MTNQEARETKREKEIINAIKEMGVFRTPYDKDEVSKVVSKAIKALEQEPKTGHWCRKTKVDAYDIAGVKTWGIKCQCDRCDFTTIVVEDFGYYDYCPHCGARMVSEKIHCTCTDEEIAKSFIEDVEAVKDLLPKTESEDKE